MATQTSLVAQQVRIRQWAEQIRNCQNRPKGMDVETWCTQNNLTKANYYYPLKRVRQMYLVSGVSGRYAWIRCRTQKPLLLWNCPHLHQIQRKQILQKNPVHAFRQELCQ